MTLAASLALALAFSRGARALDAQVEVVRGFQGQAFSSLNHFTVVLTRGPAAPGESAAPEVEVRVETNEGALFLGPVVAVAPPGTRTVVRLAGNPLPGAFWAQQPVKVVARSGDWARAVDAPALQLEGEDNVRLLLVTEGGKRPRVSLSRHRWASSAPLYLPERHEAYFGADLVLVGAADLASWSRGQARALLDFARCGGTVVFYGAIDERALRAVPGWREVLEATGPPSAEGSSLPFHVHPLRGGRVVWSEKDGGRELPVLHLRSLGPGRVGHLSVDPQSPATLDRFGGEEAFWARLEREAGGSLFNGVRGDLTGMRAPGRGGKSVLVLGGYFAAYSLLLGPVMFLVFRQRGRRVWAWAFAPLSSLGFVLASPLLFLALEASPSRAVESTTTFVDGEGGGVRFTCLAIGSTGRQDHRLRFLGDDLSAFSVTNPSHGVSVYFDASRPCVSVPLGRSEGREPFEVGRLSTVPWGDAQVLAVSSERGAPVGPRGRFLEAAPGAWTYEIEGLDEGVNAFTFLRLPGQENAGRVERITSLNDGSGRVRGALSSSGRAPGRLDLYLLSPFFLNRAIAPRGFVIWEASSLGSAVESPDLVFEESGGRAAWYLKELDTVPLAGPSEQKPTE